MRSPHSEAGFTLMELMAATALGLLVIGTAMTTFKDAVGMTNTVSNVADASQNLRGGTNFLIHDLVQLAFTTPPSSACRRALILSREPAAPLTVPRGIHWS